MAIPIIHPLSITSDVPRSLAFSSPEGWKAITTHRKALALFPHGHPPRGFFLSNLGDAVSTRFQQSGRMEDSKEAISCHREALALRPHGNPYRASSLINIGTALSTLFGESRRKDDLLDAINYLAEAKSIIPIEHPSHAIAGSRLALRRLMLCDITPKLDESLRMTYTSATSGCGIGIPLCLSHGGRRFGGHP